ncbi:hypothetical protein RF11_10749 [Thelohanellus kitauei]|uniref:Uncharacterized protein n=1 Tax=Thelohanellus kitauei TaxID=669202 RepID=A0A0C2J7B2_THEKT|nr:hypothetical protein RF11_10749 [Thelohanellus kitauei]
MSVSNQKSQDNKSEDNKSSGEPDALHESEQQDDDSHYTDISESTLTAMSAANELQMERIFERLRIILYCLHIRQTVDESLVNYFSSSFIEQYMGDDEESGYCTQSDSDEHDSEYFEESNGDDSSSYSDGARCDYTSECSEESNGDDCSRYCEAGNVDEVVHFCDLEDRNDGSEDNTESVNPEFWNDI